MGDTRDVYGASAYVGLGFLVFSTIMIVEMFGSPFLRNSAAVIGLLFGYAMAAASRHGKKKYVPVTKMDQAPGITFLWTKRPFFPLGFYPPAIIPLFIVFSITSLETWGDTAATIEASRMPTDYNPTMVKQMKGALLNDCISSIFSGLAGTLPLTTFAQNNGIIAFTGVAARRSGIACGIWLLVLGILGKVGAFIVSIPDPVLGGMTTFLFANVLMSGMKIVMTSPEGLSRRNRFIMAASLAVGLGVTFRPQWADNALWPLDGKMRDGSKFGEAKKGVRDAIILVLSTGFCFGSLVAFVLSLALPRDGEAQAAPTHHHYHKDVVAVEMSKVEEEDEAAKPNKVHVLDTAHDAGTEDKHKA